MELAFFFWLCMTFIKLHDIFVWMTTDISFTILLCHSNLIIWKKKKKTPWRYYFQVQNNSTNTFAFITSTIAGHNLLYMKESNALFTEQVNSLDTEISGNWHLVHLLYLWKGCGNLDVYIDIIMENYLLKFLKKNVLLFLGRKKSHWSLSWVNPESLHSASCQTKLLWQQ